MSDRDTCLAEPAGLTPEGHAAYTIVRAAAEAYQLHPAGLRSFYGPAEWNTLGHGPAGDAVLIVVYDGGELGLLFDTEWCDSIFSGYPNPYSWITKLQETLRVAGFRTELGDTWYCYIYSERETL